MTATTQPGSLRFLVGLAAFVVVVAGMKAATAIVVPFLLAIFIAIIVTPIFVWMTHHGVPSFVALLLIIGTLVGLFAGLIVLVGASLTEFTAQLPEYQELLRKQTQAVVAWLDERGFGASDRLAESLDPSSVMGFFGGLIASMRDLIGNSFLIVLTVIFILFEASLFPAKLNAISGRSDDSSAAHGREIIESVRNYVVIKTIISAITGVIIAFSMTILDVPFPLVWGLLAFLLNYVPNIGSIIAAVPAVILALIAQGVGTAIWTAAIFLVVNTVIGSIIEPRVMGKGLGLSTLVVFLSLVFWGWVLGPIGMLLSVPLTMTAKIILQNRDDTRWIAILLGARAPEST